MKKFREYTKDKLFTRLSFFIVFTATLLYIAFFIVKDFGNIASSVFSILGSIKDALTPLWIGLILAYLINPMVEGFENKLLNPITSKSSYKKVEEGLNEELDNIDKKRKRRKKKANKNTEHFISIIITYLLIAFFIVALVYCFTWLIMGEFVVENISDLFNSLTKLIASYETEFKSWANQLPDGVLSDYAKDMANAVVSWISENFSAGGVITSITNISSAVVNFVIGIIVSIYAIVEKDFLIRIWNKLLYLIMPNHCNTVNNALHEVNGVLSRFIRGVLLDALFVAILSSIGLSIMGLQFSVFIGIFAGISNVIPYFGPIIGMIPAFLVGLFTKDPLTGVIAVLVLFLVQQIDSNIIYPRVVGTSTGLKPLFVLLAVTVGGHYGGILGMILAVPAAGIAQIFIKKWAYNRENKLQKRENENNMNLDGNIEEEVIIEEIDS